MVIIELIQSIVVIIAIGIMFVATNCAIRSEMVRNLKIGNYRDYNKCIKQITWALVIESFISIIIFMSEVMPWIS